MGFRPTHWPLRQIHATLPPTFIPPRRPYWLNVCQHFQWSSYGNLQDTARRRRLRNSRQKSTRSERPSRNWDGQRVAQKPQASASDAGAGRCRLQPAKRSVRGCENTGRPDVRRSRARRSSRKMSVSRLTVDVARRICLEDSALERVDRSTTAIALCDIEVATPPSVRLSIDAEFSPASPIRRTKMQRKGESDAICDFQP